MVHITSLNVFDVIENRLDLVSILANNPLVETEIDHILTLIKIVDPRTVATTRYLRFFLDNREEISEYLRLSDYAATEALYEYADMFPYSWPTEEHPNFDFSLIYLEAVDWNSILKVLRGEESDE